MKVSVRESSGMWTTGLVTRGPPRLNLLTTRDMKSHYCVVPQREPLNQRKHTLRSAPQLSKDAIKNAHRDAFLCKTSGGSDAYNRFLAKVISSWSTWYNEAISQNEWDTFVPWFEQLINIAPGAMLAPAIIKSYSRAEELHQAFQAYFEPRMTEYLFEQQYTTEKAEYIVSRYRKMRCRIWRLEKKIKDFVEKEQATRRAQNAFRATLQAGDRTASRFSLPGFQNPSSSSTKIHYYESEYEDSCSISSIKSSSKLRRHSKIQSKPPKKPPVELSRLQKHIPQEEAKIRRQHEHNLAEGSWMLKTLKAASQKYAVAYNTYAKIFLPYAKNLMSEFEEQWSMKGPHTQSPVGCEGARFGGTNFNAIKTLLTIGTLHHGLYFNESNPLVYENLPSEINQLRKEPGFHSIQFCGGLEKSELFRSFITTIGSVINEANRQGAFPYTVIMPPEEFGPLEDMMKKLGVKGIKNRQLCSSEARPIEVARECQYNADSMLRLKDMTMIRIIDFGLRGIRAKIERFEADEIDKQQVLRALPGGIESQPTSQQEVDVAAGASATCPKCPKRGPREMSGGETHKHFKTKVEQRHYEANGVRSADDDDDSVDKDQA